jgi:signal transduction histidine kinase
MVIVVMSWSGIYGASELNKFGNVFDNVSLEEFSENEYYMNNLTEVLIAKWAKKEGYTETYGRLYSKKKYDKLLKGAVLEADLLVKPYGKKMTRKHYRYGAANADYTGGEGGKIIITRASSAKIKKDGSFSNQLLYDYPEEAYMFSSKKIGQKNITIGNVPFGVLTQNQQRLEKGTITVRYTKECMATIQKEYEQAQKEFIRVIKTLVIIGVIMFIGILLFIILFALEKERCRFFRAIDKIWWEVIAITAFFTAIGLCALEISVFEMQRQYASFQTDITGTEAELIMMFAYLAIPVLIIIIAVCTQTTVWRIKERKLLDSTLCVGYFRKAYRKFKEVKQREYEAMSFTEKQTQDRIRRHRIARRILWLFIFFSLCFTSVIGWVGIAFMVVGIIALKYMGKYSEQYAIEQKELGKLMKQIDRISEGELTAGTDIPEESDYYSYSKKLSNIGNGMEKALEDQMKGERMKIDLITNVSHDLKTPLTSIIGYVDLLGRDETLSAEARDYVQILMKKTERLKNIISDLFELAKSTSGDAKVELSVMDMKKLFEQTLGDMEDQIRESGFAIRFQCEGEHTKFLGDVNRMYRVAQNVLENALKYSLPGTRIFVRILERNGEVRAEVVNTASYEMDFTEEEIMERFARAEKSRSSEGNGLGLSIADSFTKNCGGKFGIEIHGDQFKVFIVFKVQEI